MKLLPPSTSDRAGRLLELDVLRAAAVLLVLGRHAGAFWPHPGDLAAPWLRPLAWWYRGGWIGVDLFFVLSGFLVSGLLYREFQRFGRLRIGRFLLRRGLKIYPAFYTLLLAHLAARALDGHGPQREALCEALFIQNYCGFVWWHTWSLAVEEHFYLLIALAFVLAVGRRSAGKDPFSWLPAAFGAVAVGCLAARIATAWGQPFDARDQLFPTHLRIDSLLFGVVLAHAYHFRNEHFTARARRYRPWLLACGLALLVPPFVVPLGSGTWLHTVGLSGLYLGSGMLLAALVVAPLAGRRPGTVRSAVWGRLGAVGAYSYSIYLWHIPVRDALLLVEAGLDVRWPPALAAALYSAAAVGFGVAMARLVEWPVLRLRDRLLPSRSRPLATGPDER